MKTVICTLVLSTALLVALVAPAGASPKGYNQSGIIGQVTGFDQPYQYVVTVFSSKGNFVTRFVTEPGGAFTVGLKPGTYVLTPFLSADGPRSPALRGLHTTVTVQKKEFTQAVLPFFLPH